MMPRVLNKARDGYGANAVYVGRPSKYGNPFKLTEYVREDALELYKDWIDAKIAADPTVLDSIKADLRGKDLVCWCSPKPCHADYLLELAND